MKNFTYLDWDAARRKEADVIKQFDVFAPTVEEHTVRAGEPDATILPVLEANAIKHRELEPSQQIPRVRIVLHGGQERELDGTLVQYEFQTSIQAANPREVRTTLYAGKLMGMHGKKSDVKGAYLNTKNNRTVYARLPQWLRHHLFPEEVHKTFQKPLNRLLKMLYGKQDSGYEWDSLLADILTELGWTRNYQASASVWVRELPSGGRAVLVVYVDDLLIVCKHEHDEIFEEFDDARTLLRLLRHRWPGPPGFLRRT